jgi:archaellum component FlaF (FlaF/FlaG flagellin family)
MSRRKREAIAARSVAAAEVKQPGTESLWKKFASAWQIWIATVVLLLLGLGVAGAISEKYKHSFASSGSPSTNAPATEPPVQTATPQLSKEYIYAGSRMLAVEDANAQSDTFTGIAGKVIYGTTPAGQTAKPVSGVQMAISRRLFPIPTETDGTYRFESLIPNAYYKITPSKGEYQHINGISPFDATMILRHIAANGQGANALNANQRIAADTSGDGNITPFDATLILRFVAAGASPNTVWVGHWRFSPASKEYPSFSTTLTDENYDAMIVGDLNGDWVPTSATQAPQDPTEYNIQIYPPGQTEAAQGSTVLIPVYFTNNSNRAVNSYSFDLLFNGWVLTPSSAAISTTGTLSSGCQVFSNTENYGWVRVAANCSSNEIAASSGTLIYLSFTVTGEPYTDSTQLLFRYSSLGTTPLFEDFQGNRIASLPSNGYLYIYPGEDGGGESPASSESEDNSTTVKGSAKAFVTKPEQQAEQPPQQQQQQPEPEKMQISLPANAAATAGNTLTIPVTLTNNGREQLSAFNFDVKFNPAFLKPAEAMIETTGTLSGNCEVIQRPLSPGRVLIVGACDKDITAAAGTLLKLRFTVAGQPNNASAQARALKFLRIPFFENHQGKRIGVGRTNGSIR